MEINNKDIHDYLNFENSNQDIDKEVENFLENSTKIQFPEFPQTKEEIWNKINQRIDTSTTTTHKETKVISIFQNMRLIAASVSLLFVLGIVFYFISTSQDKELLAYNTQISENKKVTLPDNSVVTLNAMSKITFEDTRNERVVILEGEAFFEVTKGKKFKVITPLSTIEVLGTSFNVIARGEQVKVECKTGKVKVEIPKAKFSEIITPGEMIEKKEDNQNVIVEKLDAQNIGKWVTGEFYFYEKPIEEVVKEIERQFNVKIKLELDEKKYFSGYFYQGDLNTALEMVCEPLGLNFEINDNEVTIKSL